MSNRIVVVNDKMQSGYRYVLSAPMGRDFDPEFKPDLEPAEMLALGVFGGKYMTDTPKEFPKSWFTHAKLSTEHHNPNLNLFGVDASQPLSVGATRAGSTLTTRAVGFSGIAAITWDAGFRKKIADRSSAGKRCVVIWLKFDATAMRVISPVGGANARHCCIGHTTHARCESSRKAAGGDRTGPRERGAVLRAPRPALAALPRPFGMQPSQPGRVVQVSSRRLDAFARHHQR